jgi:uncharacterized protein (DUF362 family)
MAPDPFRAGLFIGGINPVATDIVCATLMGFDYRKIPHLVNALEIKEYPILDFSVDRIEIVSDQLDTDQKIGHMNRENMFRFKPHFGWEQHIEFNDSNENG